jgi:hypothetical protein
MSFDLHNEISFGVQAIKHHFNDPNARVDAFQTEMQQISNIRNFGRESSLKKKAF